MADFDRITRNPAVMVGNACIRGMRVTVGILRRQEDELEQGMLISIGPKKTRVRVLPLRA